MINRHVNTISARLSLRPPQRESLQILADIDDLVNFTKETDPASALNIIRDAYPNVTDFERVFPCFVLLLRRGLARQD